MKGIVILILILTVYSSALAKRHRPCSYQFSKTELFNDSLSLKYNFSDSLSYTCIWQRRKIPKDSLISYIKSYNKKRSKVGFQKITLTEEEKVNFKTNLDIILIVGEKRNANNIRNSFIKKAIKNCS